MSKNIVDFIKEKIISLNYTLDPLSKEWKDQQLIGREQECEKIINILTSFHNNNNINNNNSSNYIFIVGEKGSGKTYFIKILMDLYIKIKKNTTNSLFIHYIDNNIKNSPQRIKYDILTKNFTSNNVSEYENIIKKNRNNEKKYVFIFDHLSSIFRINEFIKKIIVPLIGNTNILLIFIIQDIKEVKKYQFDTYLAKYNAQYIHFKQYTIDDLFSILYSRIQATHIPIENWLIQKILQQANEYNINNCEILLQVFKNILQLKLNNSNNVNILEYCNTMLFSYLNLQNYFNFSDIHIRTLFYLLITYTIPIDRKLYYNEYVKEIHKKNIPPKSFIWFHKKLHLLNELKLITFINEKQGKQISKKIHVNSALIKLIITQLNKERKKEEIEDE